MPNRILREGILSSERVNALGWEAEVFYRRLMSVVDDYGRYTAHPSLLRAALYPLKLETVSEACIARLLEAVREAGLVNTYEVAGKPYLELVDFRQQVRAKVSKFPEPPGRSAADAMQMPGMHKTNNKHLPGTGRAHAHLVGGGSEGANEDGGASAGPGADPNPDTNARSVSRGTTQGKENRQSESAAPLPVQYALKLREQGVAITSSHPLAANWAARGVTVAQALEAAAIARLRKPQGRIAPNYLAPILEDILNPPVRAAKATGPPAWWASETATLARGREMGLPARPGESMAEYRARLGAAMGAHA